MLGVANADGAKLDWAVKALDAPPKGEGVPLGAPNCVGCVVAVCDMNGVDWPNRGVAVVFGGFDAVVKNESPPNGLGSVEVVPKIGFEISLEVVCKKLVVGAG